MQISRITRTYRNIKRYRQILTVLFRYGFDDILNRLKIEYFIKLQKKLIPKYKDAELSKRTTAERLRLALEELGPTFIKLGQVLSIRPDLVPEDYITEFQKLLDDVPPFPAVEARAIIESQFARGIDELFIYFDDEPIAAASIAQVHRATLKDGQKVVIKIQRPNIRSVIETDLNILFDLASLIQRYIPESRLYNPTGIAQEFAKTIRRELDFIREGRNIDRFNRNFENDNTIYVPKVYWDFTTENALTMELIEGYKITEDDNFHKHNLDKSIIAHNAAQAILKQVFEHGFFHADPHPGNFFILENNVLAPLDYGMMGNLDDELKDALGDLLTAIIKKDVYKIIQVFSDIGIVEDLLDKRGLKADLTDFLDRYYQIPLYQLNVHKIMGELSEIIRKHRIKLPVDLTLMARALVTAEGIGRSLDPKLDMITLAKPYVQKLLIKRMDPRKYLKDFVHTLDDFNRLIKVLPSELKTILSKIKKGDLTIQFEHRGLEHLISELDKSSNRLSFSLIIAALIIGSSLIVQLDKGPLLFGFPVFGILGYVMAAVLGFAVVFSIFRSGKL